MKSTPVAEGNVFVASLRVAPGGPVLPLSTDHRHTVECDCHRIPQGTARAEHLMVVDETPVVEALAEGGEAAIKGGLLKGAPPMR